MVEDDLNYLVSEVLKAVEDEDVLRLAELSDHTIHNASIFQDADSLKFAVVVYALSKSFTRTRGKDRDAFLSELRSAKSHLGAKDVAGYRAAMKKVLDHIADRDKKLRPYVMHVLEEAQIKKGSRLYEHGLSMGQTAELMGVTQWELMNYVGKTSIADSTESGKHTPARVAFARKLFRRGDRAA